MNQFFSRVRNFFLPHHSNKYRPHFFTKNSLLAVASLIVFLNVAYVVHTTVIIGKTGFMASVLPGVLTSLTNVDRSEAGLSTLNESDLLKQAASMKAKDMAEKGYFAHTAPDGTLPWKWLEKVGYRYTYAGENLAVKFTDSKDVAEAWMKSPTHRANILKPEFKEIGIGTAQGIYEGKEVTFVVQFFASPQGTSPASVSPIKKVPVSVTAQDTKAPQVLGAETSQKPLEKMSVTDTLVRAAASPNSSMLYIMGAILGFILLLLFLAIVVKVRVQYLEVIGGGIILLCLIGGSFIFFNELHIKNVSLPNDTNYASTAQ